MEAIGRIVRLQPPWNLTMMVSYGIIPAEKPISGHLSKGYGSSKPVADNSTPEGRARNRRVEFIIIE